MNFPGPIIFGWIDQHIEVESVPNEQLANAPKGEPSTYPPEPTSASSRSLAPSPTSLAVRTSSATTSPKLSATATSTESRGWNETLYFYRVIS